MRAKRHLKWLFLSLAFLALPAIAGWISNANSKAFCQRRIGSWLFTQPIGGRFFYLLDPDEDADVRSTFDSMDATYSVLGFDSADPETWPRLSIKTHTLIPFFISIDYFWEREAECGGGATKVVLLSFREDC